MARAHASAFWRSPAEWLARKLDGLHLMARPLPALRARRVPKFPLHRETVVLDAVRAVDYAAR